MKIRAHAFDIAQNTVVGIAGPQGSSIAIGQIGAGPHVHQVV